MYKCYTCGEIFVFPVSVRQYSDPYEEAPFEEAFEGCPNCRGSDIAKSHTCAVCCDFFPEENGGIFVPEWGEFVCENCYKKV